MSSGSPRSWPARTGTRWPSTTWNRGRSRSTRPTAPAPSASAWASARRSTPTWWCPTRTSRWPRARWRRGRSGHTAEYFTRMMAGLGDALGFDVDTPWRKLPAKARKAILEGCRRAGACAVPQPVRPHPLVLRRVRRRDGVPATQDGPDRVRADEGTLRGLHAGRAVPGV